MFNEKSKGAQIHYPSHQLTRRASKNSRNSLIKVIKLDDIRMVGVDKNLAIHDQVIDTEHRLYDCELFFLGDAPVLV